MENRVYVTNLSDTTSLTSLRRCFAGCGEVTEVEFAAERNAPRTSTSAYVTMGTPAAAAQAVRTLNGTILEGRLLMVSLAPPRTGGTDRFEQRGRGRRAEVPTGIAITQQYRERHNMTYELDYLGARLILRIFFPAETGDLEWRIEARSSAGGSEIFVEGAATTRSLALKQVSEAWQALPDPTLPSFDWQAVTIALQTVRAI